MNTNEIILKHLRDFMIACVAVGIYLLAFGILLAVFLTGHTLFRRVFLSLCCFIPAVILIVSSIWMYVGEVKRRVV